MLSEGEKKNVYYTSNEIESFRREFMEQIELVRRIQILLADQDEETRKQRRANLVEFMERRFAHSDISIGTGGSVASGVANDQISPDLSSAAKTQFGGTSRKGKKLSEFVQGLLQGSDLPTIQSEAA